MCILMVILRVITINYSHRALVINFSLGFFFYGELLGGMIVQATPPPHLKYWGGGGIYPPPPHPPGIDTHACYLWTSVL